MRIKASEPFSNSVVTNTKTGGTSALELSPSQETLPTTTTASNTKNTIGATTAMTQHLQEPNVKKETAEWSANDKEQHNTHLFSSSPLVEQLSLEERELGTANSNTYKRIQEEPKCECNANITFASTNLVHATEETAHGDFGNRVSQKNIGSMECNLSCSASSNCFTSIMAANSQSAPSVISASPSPPPLLNSSAYTAAALHGKRLPPSRQRSGYSANAINAVNKTNNNNKTNSLFSKNSVNNDSNKCTKPFSNITKDDNGSNNKFSVTCRRNIHNECERANCEECVNCKDANNNGNSKHCDQMQENSTVEQTCASLSSDQEVYREAKSAPLPSTNTVNNANEDDKNATVAEQTNNDKNNASKTDNTTHCNAHLRHANLCINLPSSFVRSSQLCDSEVESVVTTSSSSSSSSFSNIITSGNIGDGDMCSRHDSFTSTSSSSNNSNSANKKSNNRSHLCYSDDCGTNHFHPFYAHYRNTFRNDRNGRNWHHHHKYIKHINSCDNVQSNDCKVCNGDVKNNGEINELKTRKSYSSSTTQRRDKCTFDYIPRRRHLSFYTHATPTLDNAELSSNCSWCHSHSAPTYYKRNHSTSTCAQEYCTNSKINCNNCGKSEEKSSNSFASEGKNYTTNLTSMNSKDDNNATSSTATTSIAKQCTHSSSLTLEPSSHSEHHVSSSNYQNVCIGNKTNDKCTPLSPYSSPHHFHYHNHPDEQNTYTNKNIFLSEEKVENSSFMSKGQNQMWYVRNNTTEWKWNTDNTSNTTNGCNETSTTLQANIAADKNKARKNVNKHQFHIQVPSEPYGSPQSSELFSLTNPFPPSATLSTSPNASNISSNVLSSSCTLSRSSVRKTGMKCHTRAQYTNFMHSEFSAVEVLPGLYLGTRVDANDLQLLREHDISLVINVSEDCPVPPAELTNPLHIRVIQFALKDHSDEVIAPFFVPITDIIHQQLHRRQAYQHFMKKQAEIVPCTHANHDAHDNPNTTVNTNSDTNNENNISCYSIPDSVKPYSSSLHKHNNKKDDASITKTCSEIKTLNNYIAQDNEQITLQSNNGSNNINNQSISKINRKNKYNNVTYSVNEKEQERNDLVSLLHRFLPSEAMRTLPCVPTQWPCVDARDCGGVLIHCRMGVSRSASFVLAYLILYGSTLASLTDPFSLFTTLPFTEKQLAERVGGRVTWGAAFESWVNKILEQNRHKQRDTHKENMESESSTESTIKETTLENSNRPLSPPQHVYTLQKQSLNNYEKKENVPLDKSTTTTSSFSSEIITHNTLLVNNVDEHGAKNVKSNIDNKHDSSLATETSQQCVNSVNSYNNHNNHDHNNLWEEFCKMLEELMQKDSLPQNNMELSCTTPRARAAYNCIACWRLRQQRQRWALAKHVLMGHSHTLLSTNSSFTSTTSTSKSEQEEEQQNKVCTFLDNSNNNNIKNSPTQRASSFALFATSPLSCVTPSQPCWCPLNVQDQNNTNTIRNNKESKVINGDEVKNSVSVCNIDNNSVINDTSPHHEPIMVASMHQGQDEEFIQSEKPQHVLPSKLNKEELCTCSSKTKSKSISSCSSSIIHTETTTENANAHSVPVLRETSYSKRRKLKQASLVHRRESYYGHDTLSEQLLRNLTPHKLGLHTSFASHSVPSFSLSATTPLCTLSPTHETFCSANITTTTTEIAAAATSPVCLSSPLLSCMHTSQLTQFTRPLVSSPVSSFASAPLTSPLTEQTKNTFEENIVRSSMRPPYLEIVTGMSYREAFEFLKSKKHDISPNIGFVLALRELAAGNDFSVSSSN